MKKGLGKLLGGFMAVMGVFLLSGSVFRTTGYIISDRVSYDSFVGFVFIILGSAIFMLFQLGGLERKTELTRSQEKALSKLVEEKKNKRVGTYKELGKMAEKAGYTLKLGGKHISVFSPEGKKITILPHGNKVNKYTYFGALEDLLRDAGY